MALTALTCSPAVAAIGQAVTVVPVGTPDGDELRFYLLSAPPGSQLPTLATYQARGLALEDVRLKMNGAGQALFTPDVPGLYRVVVRDVVLWRFVPHYGDQVPAVDGSQALALDNELAALPAYAGGTAQAADFPPGGVQVPVHQQVSRTIGFGQDTASLSLRVYAAGVADTDVVADAVKLTPGPTAPARIAVFGPRVLQVLGQLQDGDASTLADHHALLPAMVSTFNEHCALTSWKTHTIADPGNSLSTTAVAATLPAIATRLGALVTAYNAHRQVTAGSVHLSSDGTNVMGVFPCTTLEEAIRWVEHAYAVLFGHASNYEVHSHTPPQSFVDGYFGQCVEPPTTLAEVAQCLNGQGRWTSYGLSALYEQHRQRAIVAAHYDPSVDSILGPDTTNAVRYLGGSLSNLILTGNALAEALNRHVQNLTASSTPPSDPDKIFHYPDAPRSRLVRSRASDGRTLALLIEELWLCLESHLWSAGPSSGYVQNATAGQRGQHPDRVFGNAALVMSADFVRPSLMVRLAKAWDQALSPDAPVPDGMSTLPTLLQLRAGFG